MEMLNGNVSIRFAQTFLHDKERLKHSCTHVRLKGTVNSLRAALYQLNVYLKEQTMVQKWIRNTLPQ